MPGRPAHAAGSRGLIPVRAARAAAAALFFGLAFPLWAKGKPSSVKVDTGVRATVKDDAGLLVEPRRGDGWDHLAKRYGDNKLGGQALRKFNRFDAVQVGRPVWIPGSRLSGAWRYRMLRALYPKDEWTADGVRHTVGSAAVALPNETLSLLALHYTGDANARAVELVKGRNRNKVRSGDVALIPAEALVPSLWEKLPKPKPDPKPAPEAAPAPEPGPETAGTTEPVPPVENAAPPTAKPAAPAPATPAQPASPSAANDLTWGTDEQGPYALYRLKPGEALYSAVVIRFTDRVDADEVNGAAFRIAARSGIEDVTDIAIGYPVKIPQEMLADEFKPPESAERKAWEEDRREVAEVDTNVRANELEGVVVILDAGHGGIDPGAMANDVWEDDYVYDVACRIKERLETQTRARVLMTLMDPSVGYRVQDVRQFKRDNDEVLLTHPWYNPVEPQRSEVGVNLRWALVNTYAVNLVRHKVEPENIVFTSIHADALHPNLHGSMVYVPGARHASNACGLRGPLYDGIRESATSRVSFSERDKIRAEAFSRVLADALIKESRNLGLDVHPEKPVRGNVVRGGAAWIPAVIKCSDVPTRILWEICNLNNPHDAGNLKDPAFRQKLADAYVAALLRVFSGVPEKPAP